MSSEPIPEIAAFAHEHELGPELARELQDLVRQLVDAERRPRLAPASVPSATMILDDGPEAGRMVDGESHPTGDRYERVCLLGAGGMGEVWRVLDRNLNRTTAMKVIGPEAMTRSTMLARFVEEAQCTAQLQHPGIVPVHDLGRFDDGRVFFTMREVQGRTLSQVIAEVHGALADRDRPAGPESSPLRRLVEAFRRVCEAVAYAHARRVVHRDLKPDNVMLGEHGDVLVVDWGLSKVAGRGERADDRVDLDPVVTDRSRSTSTNTRLGAIAGTPAYMPPEQARGEVDRVDARSDVYALGAILYQVLSGRPPFQGDTPEAVLERVLAGPPPPLAPQIAPALVAAMERAMAPDPRDRFANAGELSAEIAAWLEGARLKQQALDVADRALGLEPESRVLRDRALALRREAVQLLEDVKAWEPAGRKAPAWAKQDEAEALEQQASRIEAAVERGLHGALRIDPTLPEVHAALATRLLAAHAAAETARRTDAASRAELALGEHSRALPADHEVRLRCAAYLKGDGALTLVTDPPGAEVLLHRYVTRNRRLVPELDRSLGRTPLASVSLPKGSYLCVLRHPERADVHYPVHIGRMEHWDGVPPGATEAFPVPLPEPGELASDEGYVPPGWFWSGGDTEAVDGLPLRRLWCDGFMARRFQVTNAEYIRFLDALVAEGHEDLALAYVPREEAGSLAAAGAALYGRDAQGRFILRTDSQGDTWLADWPVMMVHWGCAVAYARREATRTGRPWRLPAEFEREKASRGVDGRFFPWGDVLDPSWCCMRDSHPVRPLPTSVGQFPQDVSVYGIRDVAGNMREWCADLFSREGPSTADGRVRSLPLPEVADLSPSVRRANRGGLWNGFERASRVAGRGGGSPHFRTWFLGIRLFRSFRGTSFDDVP